MNKRLLTASLFLALAITLPVHAQETHTHGNSEPSKVMQHNENQPAPDTAQMDMQKMDTAVQQMQEMRKKIAMEKDPAMRNKLMHQHMQMMQDNMNMMNMMGGQGMMMGNQPGMKGG